MSTGDIAKIDVLFVIALEEEFQVFEDLAGIPKASSEPYQGLRIYWHSLKNELQEQLRCATLLIGDQGPEAATSAMARVLQFIQPKLVVNIGISGRIDEDFYLCDVVIASDVDNPLYRAKIKDGTIKTAGRSFPVALLSEPIYHSLTLDLPLLQLETGLIESELELLQKANYVGSTAGLRFGPIFATPFVIDDQNFSVKLKDRNRLFGAADMESGAIVNECWKFGIVDGRLLVVRGLSDPANGKKKELDQIRGGVIRKIAMNNAVTIALEAVRRLTISAHGLPSILKNEQTDPAQQQPHTITSDLNEIHAQIEAGSTIDAVCVKFESAPLGEGTLNELRELAKRAFEYEISEDESSKLVLSKFNQTAIDFLVARHVMTCVLTEPSSKEHEKEHYMPVSYVYPQRINRFCKGIMGTQLDEHALTTRLLRASELFATKTPQSKTATKSNNSRRKRESLTQSQARAHACYLLGRLRKAPQMQKAANTLEQWLNEVFIGRYESESERENTLLRKLRKLESKEDRMLVRTILISLVLLGKSHKSEEYLKACLRDRKFDELNRGFHLEYYGDLEYDRRDSMSHIDDLRVFPKTFEHLFQKIKDSFDKRVTYPLRDIELQTLFSLCQHRHAAGVLDNNYITRLVNFFKDIPPSITSSQLQLRSYIRMVLGHIKIKFSEAQMAFEVYQLKKRPRTGWIAKEREVASPESIMSHIGGGLKLIYFFAPDRLSREDIDVLGTDLCRGYSKDRLLRMYLIHDWAEAYTGDLLPTQRTDITAQEEEMVMSEIDNFSTYSNVELSGTYALWREFQSGNTINGRIVRDFDKLDNLLQLEIEKRDASSNIPDYIAWREELLQDIRTPLGKRIATLISP